MPSHKIHLAIAKKVNDKINTDLDSLMLGSVLPDLSIGKDHTKSHYQNGKLGVEGTANHDLFIKKYKDKLNNPVMLGYILHLLTDKFYNDFYYNTAFDWIEHNKNFKHNLFGSYDKYLLKHGYINKIKNKQIINSIPNYKDISFNNEFLSEYIDKLNDEIDNTIIDEKYNIEHQEFLDTLYNDCLNYINNVIDNYR